MAETPRNSRYSNKKTDKIPGVRGVLNPEMGKLPPQALELEEAVLGAMLIEPRALNTVIDLLKPESFYKEAHTIIFECMREMFQAGTPVDILTVTQELRKLGRLDFVGGPLYISNLTNRIGSTANIEAHARVVTQKYIQRELIAASNEIIKKAYDETTDTFELLDEAEQNIFKVAEGNIRKSSDKMSALVTTALEAIAQASKNQDGISGVPTGFTAVDKLTGGWQRSDMIVIAARPGMGKTAFVLSMARNVAVDYQRAVAVFSLEMSGVQLVQRLIASESGFNSDKLRKGQLTQSEMVELNQRITKLQSAQIFIDDTPALSVFELRAKCRRLKANNGIQLVIIDYLQLMTAGDSKGGNREQEISTISRSIKQIAKELDVPVIALSQLSRSVETRGGDKKPMLSDLRESGAIEQDADIVGFIYRPEYYGLTEFSDNERTPSQGLAELIVAKHRHGGLDNIRLRFISNLAKFADVEGFNYDNPFAQEQRSIQANSAFLQTGGGPTTITVSSKMNDMSDDDDFLMPPNEESPF
jgi:replicative DNA helicase